MSRIEWKSAPTPKRHAGILVRGLAALGAIAAACVLMGSSVVPSAYSLIQNNGTPVARRSTLNFTSGVSCTDNAGTKATDCAAAASGGGVATYSAPAVTLPAAGTTFFPPAGGGLPSGTEANVQGASPAATISSFYVQLSANIGGGNTLALTFRKAGVDQAVTCTISGTTNSCNDTTHSFSVAAGDLLTIKAITSGTVVITPTIVIMYSTGSGGSSGTVISAANACLSIGANCYFGTRFLQATVPGPISFSWQNQGFATVATNGNGTTTMTVPAQSTDSIHLRYVAVPAAPYTVTGCFSGTFMQANSAGTGLALSDGTGIITLAIGYDSTVNATGTIQSLKFTDATTFNSVYSNLPWGNSTQNVTCLRFQDDGVNRLSFYSADGQNFFPFLSQGHTDFITPTRVGWFYNETNNAGGTTTLISWTSTSP